MSVIWDTGIVDRKIAAAATRVVVAMTEAIVEEGNRRIATPPKTGRVYTRRGVKHQASAPGESPATDLGGLIASGRAIYPTQGDFFQIAGYANWSTVYARGLELGTERVDARPYARPAMDTIAVGMPSALAAEITTELS